MVKLLEKWPYWPPSHHDFKPLSDIFYPSGFILLSEAVEMMGKATFGEEWTGEELKARRVIDTDFEEPSRQDGAPRVLWPDGIETFPENPNRWHVGTTQGILVVDSEEEARSLWNREKPKLIDMWWRELAARRRCDQIVRKLRGDLAAEIFPSWALQTKKEGPRLEIPSYVWESDDILSVFELGDHVDKWRNPNIIKFSAPLGIGGYGEPVSVEGRVILRQSDIERHLSPPQETAPTPPGGTDEGKGAELPELKQDDGRPPDKQQRTHDVEAEALLKNHINAVLAKAKATWPDPESWPSINEMARLLVEGQPKSKVEGFGQEAIRKILAGTYKPAKDKGIPGLSSG